jgi:hypothetical protein
MTPCNLLGGYTSTKLHGVTIQGAQNMNIYSPKNLTNNL